MVWPIGRPVSASQSRAVRSPLPREDRPAIGAERDGTHLRGLRDERAGGPEGGPVPLPYPPSEQPVSRILPSGLNATLITDCG